MVDLSRSGWGRMENAWHGRNDIIGTSQFPPSHYLGRFYVDSVVFDERALRLLVDTVGVGPCDGG